MSRDVANTDNGLTSPLLSKRKLFGKSVFLPTHFEGGTVVWAIYEGMERDGTRGKEPIAWFRHWDDAAHYVFGDLK